MAEGFLLSFVVVTLTLPDYCFKYVFKFLAQALNEVFRHACMLHSFSLLLQGVEPQKVGNIDFIVVDCACYTRVHMNKDYIHRECHGICVGAVCKWQVGVSVISYTYALNLKCLLELLPLNETIYENWKRGPNFGILHFMWRYHFCITVK